MTPLIPNNQQLKVLDLIGSFAYLQKVKNLMGSHLKNSNHHDERKAEGNFRTKVLKN
jgi:hypothetical protein